MNDLSEFSLALLGELDRIETKARTILTGAGFTENQIRQGLCFWGDEEKKLFPNLGVDTREYYALWMCDQVQEIRNLLRQKPTQDAMIEIMRSGFDLGRGYVGLEHPIIAKKIESKLNSERAKGPREKRGTRTMVRIAVEKSGAEDFEALLNCLRDLAEDEGLMEDWIESASAPFPFRIFEVKDDTARVDYRDLRNNTDHSVSFKTLEYNHFNPLRKINSG